MRSAIVQEYLTQDGGAEAVYRHLAALLPDADLYAFFSTSAQAVEGRPIQQTWVAPVARRLRDYRVLFPLFARLARSLPVRDYDLVVSSSFGLAKAVRLRDGQVHVCYCHTPPRWLYDMNEAYLEKAGGGPKKAVARMAMERLRRADQEGAARVDAFVANSRFVQGRIRRAYGRDSTVVYPPVDVARFAYDGPKAETYFTLSRLVAYKNVDKLVEAFRLLPDRTLVVGGSGPELPALRKRAPPNVRFLGRVPDGDVVRLMGEAKAFLFAAEEDFGIAPVEAQAAGTPIVAYGRGGALETVVDGKTGVFFDDLGPEAIRDAVLRLDDALPRMPRDALRAHAAQFSPDRFHAGMRAVLAAQGAAP